MLLFAMVCGTVPFKAPSMPDLHKLILKAEFVYPSSVSLSEGVRDLIGRLILLKPLERLTIPEILLHPWVAGSPGSASPDMQSSLFLEGEEHISEED